MSIKILRLGTIGIKELIGSYIREHGSEIAIAGIMTTILVGIGSVSYRGHHAGTRKSRTSPLSHREKLD